MEVPGSTLQRSGIANGLQLHIQIQIRCGYRLRRPSPFTLLPPLMMSFLYKHHAHASPLPILSILLYSHLRNPAADTAWTQTSNLILKLKPQTMHPHLTASRRHRTRAIPHHTLGPRRGVRVPLIPSRVETSPA